MAHVFRNLFLLAATFTFAGVMISSIDVAAQDKKKKKTDDKKVTDKDAKDKDAKDKDAKDKDAKDKDAKDKDAKDKDAKDKDKKDKDGKDKDKKEEKKKEDFKPDTPAKEFKYVEKDKKDEKERTFWVYSVAFGNDGKTVAASYRDHAVRIWDLGKKDAMTLKGPVKDAKGLADYRSVLVVGNQVFVGTGKWNTEKKAREGEIRVWDAKSGKVSKPLAGHTQEVEALAISKDGKFLASASQDNTVLIWNLGEGKTTQTIKGHSDYVTGVSFSPDGKQLVTTSKDKTVRVWDIGGAKEIAAFKVEREVETKDAKGKVTKSKELGREFTRAVFTNDGKNVITGNLDGIIKIYDVEAKKETKELKAHEGVWALALSPDGSKFATGGWDGTIKIWSTDGKEMRTIKAHLGAAPNVGGNVTSVAFSPDGQWLASGGIDGTVKVWAVK
jgi:WD40 repeat protein